MPRAYTRRRILIEVIEVRNPKIPLEHSIYQKIITADEADQLFADLEGIKTVKNNFLRNIGVKRVVFARANERNQNIVPWTEGYGFTSKADRLNYFIEKRVKVKFTLVDYVANKAIAPYTTNRGRRKKTPVVADTTQT